MGRYLLDSNAFLTFKAEPHKLRKEAHEAITAGENRIFISLASLWEMGIKAANGKLPQFAKLIASGPGALREALRESDFTLLQIELEHAMAAIRLPQHHRDPFDRMMIAQAQLEGLTLISNDGIFERYAGLSLLSA
jgi:PIN domain nuclease of toxin-antitoxin system